MTIKQKRNTFTRIAPYVLTEANINKSEVSDSCHVALRHFLIRLLRYDC